MDPDTQLQLRQCSQQGVQGSQVELVGEALYEALHEVLLGYVVLARHNLLQDPWVYNLLNPHKSTSDALQHQYVPPSKCTVGSLASENALGLSLRGWTRSRGDTGKQVSRMSQYTAGVYLLRRSTVKEPVMPAYGLHGTKGHAGAGKRRA